MVVTALTGGPAVFARLAVAALLLALPAHAQTLKVVLSNELTSLDPVQSTAAFVRNHGFMVYDQLFALDSKGEARPEMVESFTRSDDGRSWRFTLRPGLAFHDGSPVRAQDAVASIRRWWQRDTVGKALAAATGRLEAVDERSFVLELARPFALVTEALARPTASALFVMPERLADTPPGTAITDATGSGPWIFNKEEWQPGYRATYRRNPAYQPRPEPPDGLAGGKVAKFERIEWYAMPDGATAAAALRTGEIDVIEQPAPDLVPALERAPGVSTFALNPVGLDVWLRINHLQKPFDDPRARQALLYLIDQKEILDAIGIRPSEQVPYCPAWFMCGTPLESSAGARGLQRIDVEKARALLKEAGYAGQPVLFMNPADNAPNSAATLTMAENFRKAGLVMDVPSMDWATVTQRRNKKEPVAQGGWSLFITIANALDGSSPLTNLYLASPCENGIAGWPCDPKLEALRRAWWEESDPAKRMAILQQVQAQAFESLPYINAGQYRTLAAYRSNLQGLRATTIPVFWGVERR
jgi:peptide/nickel transport system substrate-binding protein